MSARRLLNGLVVLTLLVPTLATSNLAPTRAATEPLNTLKMNEATDSLIWRPHPEAGYEERDQAGESAPPGVPRASVSDLSDFSASAIQPSSGSYTWDSDADFVGGAFDHTEVVSGTGQVTLLRRWTPNVKVNDDTGSASQYTPSLAVDGSGNLYLAWGDERNGDADIYFARSTDGGVTWSANVNVNGGRTPSLAVDGSGDLYLAWGDDCNRSADIYFARSTDSGATWSASVIVNDTDASVQCDPSLAVSGSGNLYVAWRDDRNGTTDSDIYFARSTDGGTTWLTNTNVISESSSVFMTHQFSPSLVMDGSGNLYLAWGDGRSGDAGVYFARSADGGATWSPNIQVDDDPGDHPSLVVDGSGNLYLAWDGVYFARSTDGGTTWSAKVQVGGGGQPSLTVDGSGNLYLAWDGVYFARSTDGGATWSAGVKVGGGGQPSLAVDESGDIHLAWAGNGDIYTARWPDNAYIYTNGTYTSKAYDVGELVAWNSMSWTDMLPAGTVITSAVRVGHSARWSGWYTFTTSPADLSSLPPSRYLQWKAYLSSPVSTTTSALDAVTVAWDGLDYTEIEGFIAADTLWSAAESPYLVTDNVVVDVGATLTIEPGVTVWFSDTRALQVLGGLVAQGTPTQPITFTSWHVSPQPDDWGGIAFADTSMGASFDADGNYLSGSVLQYATVEYAGSGSFACAVDAPRVAVYVDHCTVRNNGSGGLRVGGSGNYVTNNTIVDNAASSHNGGGICNEGTDTTISGNIITGNSASDGGGVFNMDLGVTISGNTITDNSASDGGGICTGADSFYTAISGNTISGNSASSGGGVYIGGALATISGNTISGNSASTGGGIAWNFDGDIVYNTIISNTASGGTGGIWVSGHPRVRHNTLQGNEGYALYNNNASEHLDARYNWWGTADGTAVWDLIYDWFDDTGRSIVDYVPYLTTRPDLKPAGANVSGRTVGLVNTAYSFDVSVYPLAAITPITFTWQAIGQAPVTRVSEDLYDTASFTWAAIGPKTITATVSNSKGMTSTAHIITITQSSTYDAYETDDACAQAKEITTDGTPQPHTFHDVDDVDWASFQAISGTIYIVEAITPDDSEADLALELYDACDGTVQDGQDNAFSPDVSLSFTAPQDGPLYVRLADNRSTVGAEAATYYLSVRALPQTAPTGAVVIVAGKNKATDALQSNIYHVTNSAYQLFQANGYDHDTIQYLAPDPSLDADGDGTPDVDVVSTKTGLEHAITTWAADKVDTEHAFTLYMMDHGSYDGFYLNYLGNRTETISAYELDTWLDQLEDTRPGVKINLIVEACHSGSFIDLAQTVSGQGRVVIASTGAYPLAYASDDGAIFSDAFVAALGRGMSLYSGFEEARWAAQQAHPDQTPWLDDNGDGIPNGTGDGQKASQRGFAYAGTLDESQWPPFIARAVVNQGTGVIQAEVQVAESKALSEVWALVYPPSYEPPESGEDLELEDVPRVDLTDPDQDGVYTGAYSFVEAGMYRVVIYAVDTTELGARPREANHVTYDEPVLDISKVGPMSAGVGDLITYTLTVTNSGTVEATNLVITDALPTGAHLVHAGSGTLLLPGEIVRWELPSLAKDGGIATVQFVVTATETIVNNDYRASADGGVSAVGSEAVVTAIGSKTYLPLVMRNFP